MLKYIITSIFLLLSSFLVAQKLFDYPISIKDDYQNDYFGVTVEDPYQWMEKSLSPKVSSWIENQKRLTARIEKRKSHLLNLRTQIATMYTKIKTVKTQETEDKKRKSKDRFEFEYRYNDYSETPDLMYRVNGTKNYKTLVKIRDFKKKIGDIPRVEEYVLNENQNIVAVVFSLNGGDWREVRFYNLLTGEAFPETLKNLRIKSNLIWHNDGIYYDRYHKPEEGRELIDKAKGQALYYHKVNTDQDSDKLLYQNPDITGTNSFSYFKQVDKIFFYHFYKSKEKLLRALSYATIKKDYSLDIKNFLIYPNNKDINFSIEVFHGDTVLLNTNWNAPNGKVLGANINELNKPFELIPQYDINLREVNRLGKNKLACIYRDHGKFYVFVYDFKGKLLKKIGYPEGKKVNYFYEYNTKADYTDFCVSSFFHPDIWYRINFNDLSIETRGTTWVPYNAKTLETRYVHYTSKDGTKVPMYITCLKKTELNKKNPVLLYGYGGYGITIEPAFNEAMALWLLHGGILAVPNVRGGGAGGKQWGNKGSGLNKQNAIDDFIAAAEYLIKEKYTLPEKIVANGASHGGLLVGAAMTQRPELFKAVIAEAGVFDMLRFENYTVGSTSVNRHEFGSVNIKEEFDNLIRYSPLHNIKKGVKYPNTLLITGDKDDRVPPFHSYKFLATLQEKGSSKSLYQLYVIPGSGHGGALTPNDWVDKLLFKYRFLFNSVGLKYW